MLYIIKLSKPGLVAVLPVTYENKYCDKVILLSWHKPFSRQFRSWWSYKLTNEMSYNLSIEPVQVLDPLLSAQINKYLKL